MISGFTTASAIIIALSQAKDFLGYSVVRSSEIIPLVKSIIAGADQVNLCLELSWMSPCFMFMRFSVVKMS